MGLFSSLFKKASTAPTVPAKTNLYSLDPSKIDDICFALCWLIGEVNDSWLTVCLQDENANNKICPEYMSVVAVVDNHKLNYNSITSLNTAEAYQKLGLPFEIADFLAAIPFEQKNFNELKYVFPKGEYPPSYFKQRVLSAMQDGVTKARRIQMNTARYKIEDRGILTCKVD